MRINNYISASGFCSRREADALVLAKKVKINGRLAEMGSQVKDKDRVEVNGKRIEQLKKHVYIMLNKPAGIVCTTERKIRGNIIAFVGHKERIFPIGRLDKDSEGLILLTSDGSIVNEILREENQHDKEYQVSVNKEITPEFLIQMSEGVTIFNPVKEKHEMTKPCVIHKNGEKAFTIVLSQGLNRQIRRMCEALGYQVVNLKRVRIMHIKLGKLKTGVWRDLSEAEVNGLIKKQNQTETKLKAQSKAQPKAQSKALPQTKAKAQSKDKKNVQGISGVKRSANNQNNSKNKSKKSGSSQR